MRVIIQRVSEASVTISENLKSEISIGLLILLGIEQEDTNEDIDWLCGKISRLRIFDDDEGVMNLSVKDIEGEVLLISQFTLHASTKKGNRPSYIRSAKADISKPFYDDFVKKALNVSGLNVKSGIFGADMKINLINDGPVTIILEN